MDKGTTYLEGIKSKIRKGDLDGAEMDLHRLLVNRDFDALWGCKSLPVIWGYIAHIRLDTTVPTACVDLPGGKVLLNPQFILDKVHCLMDLLFIVLHERDHRILRRIFRINWHKLSKILDYKMEWIVKVRNVLEDAWINASVRAEMGIASGLPERFYCWTEEDAASPGPKSPENPDGSGFDPAEHKIGEPKSDEFALLTCLSSFVDDGIETSHRDLYLDAHSLLAKHGLTGRSKSRSSSRYDYYDQYDRYSNMLSFPAWYDAFCDWLSVHKDDLAQPSPGCKGDDDCPVHGNPGQGEGDGEGEGDESGSGAGGEQDGDGDCAGEGGSGSGSEAANDGSGGGDSKSDPNKSEGDAGDDGKPTTGNHEHGGNKKCTCRGGEGLLGEPMTLAERLSRVPDIVISKDELDKILDGLDDGSDKRKGPKPDKPLEVFKLGGRGAGWGGVPSGTEVVPHEIQSLDEIDRELLEMGGSALTEAWKTSTVQIKGAVKQYADELVQSIATMRVTEHKIMRPDFNIPVKPSRRDIINMGMGNIPVMWQHPQYLEQQELIVYTDVSGSMCSWYSVALYLTQQLAEFGCELYQFSTIVCKPVPGRDDNIFWGDGGTHFDTVAEHIRLKGFKAVIIITDNCDALSEKYHDHLRELPELYAIFLQSGNRPRGKSPGYGGSYGRAGWQTVTDKITAIYSSDIGKGYVPDDDY